MRRILAVLTALAVLLVTVPALAEQTVSARTPAEGSAEKLSNIDLAAAAISGIVVPYGGSFSFNAAVGPRTAACGYRDAPNGRGAVVTGGGVAQVATTLYLALLQIENGIVFDELSVYGNRFADSYVSDGSQAVLVDYSAGRDFAFTNYTDDLNIEIWRTEDYLYCSVALSGQDASAAEEDFFTWAADDDSREKVSTARISLNASDSALSNIALAADSIYDTTLPSGEIFSFNDIVGPRIERCGYLPALNGRGAEVTGGGVAQVASAVWLAVKNLDGVAIVEKSTYGSRYNQSYVESSNDAILTDYNSGQDFSFRNSGDVPLTICTYIDGGDLVCDIYRG